MPARPQSEGPLLTQQFTIFLPRPDGMPIPVVVTKKRVKNFNLRVTSSGEVHASAPLGASRERIEAFVKRNSAWIISRLAQREQRQTTAQEPLSPSSIIALWGTSPSRYRTHSITTLYHPHRDPSRPPSQVFMGYRRIGRRPTGQAARNPRRSNVRRAPSPHRPALYVRSHIGAARYGARIRNRNGRLRFPRFRTQHENALGLVHAQIRRHSHRTRTCRLPRRMPRHGCRPRARPLARAKPQSAVSRPARHVLPQQ